jgi:hypothetical protein
LRKNLSVRSAEMVDKRGKRVYYRVVIQTKREYSYEFMHTRLFFL